MMKDECDSYIESDMAMMLMEKFHKITMNIKKGKKKMKHKWNTFLYEARKNEIRMKKFHINTVE